MYIGFFGSDAPLPNPLLQEPEASLLPRLEDRGMDKGWVNYYGLGMQTTVTSSEILRPAVFFDRDGVLNVDRDFVYKVADLEWIDGAMDAVRWCNAQGYWVFVVTNQSGIARGYYSEADMHIFHQHMQDCLSIQSAHIDAFSHCPHHPQGTVPRYTQDCACRKPKAGMIRELLASWPVDVGHSLLVGDSPRDLQAAQAAGIKAALFSGGNLQQFLLQHLPAHASRASFDREGPKKTQRGL